MTEQEFWFEYAKWLPYLLVGKVVDTGKGIDIAYKPVPITEDDEVQGHVFYIKDKVHKYLTVINTSYPKHKKPENIVWLHQHLCHELYKGYKQYMKEIANGTAPIDEAALTLLETMGLESTNKKFEQACEIINKLHLEFPCGEPDNTHRGIAIKNGKNPWHSI
jgi:hypoxanthine phosphoribosyltransferase